MLSQAESETERSRGTPEIYNLWFASGRQYCLCSIFALKKCHIATRQSRFFRALVFGVSWIAAPPIFPFCSNCGNCGSEQNADSEQNDDCRNPSKTRIATAVAPRFARIAGENLCRNPNRSQKLNRNSTFARVEQNLEIRSRKLKKQAKDSNLSSRGLVVTM